MTYSVDFRKKVLLTKEQENLTFLEVSKQFRVGVASVERWSKNIEGKKTRNKLPTKMDWEKLVKDVEEHPDSYQYERAKRFGVSKQGIGYALKRLNISCKKKTFKHPKANEQAQQKFREQIEGYHKINKPIVYIDESGFANDMPRRNGYAPIGQRCCGERDWGAKGRTNVIGALLFGLLLTVNLLTGNVNSNIFYNWVTQDLLPKLPPECVIVMDNASFHKRLDIQQSIRDAGHTLLFLPPYSPELNPIEHKWAQAKAIRKQEYCSIPDLFTKYNI
jgi:transposase